MNFLTTLLFICLIGSIHSASFRMKREDGDETTSEQPATDSITTTEATSEPTTTKGPFDITNWGQFFPVSNSDNWVSSATGWFNNVPSWFGSRN